MELVRVKECITAMSLEMDRKLADLTFDYNHRIANLTAENERLASVVVTLWDAHNRQLLYEQAAAAVHQQQQQQQQQQQHDQQQQAQLQVKQEPDGGSSMEPSTSPHPTAAVPTSLYNPPQLSQGQSAAISSVPLPAPSSVATDAAAHHAALATEPRMQSLSQAVAMNLSSPSLSPPHALCPDVTASFTANASHPLSSLLHHLTTQAQCPVSASEGITSTAASPSPPVHTATVALNGRHQLVLAAAVAAEAATEEAATAIAETGMTAAGTKRKQPDDE
jgi:hypothetical protein